MNATLSAARIDGQTEAFLSLHTTHEGAIAALLARGAKLYRDRFGYVPADLEQRSPEVLAGNGAIVLQLAEDRLLGGGWNARVEEVEVHLDAVAP